MLIRRMTVTDLSSWAELRHQLWERASAAEHLSDLSDLIEREKVTGYGVFISDDLIVGFAEVSIRDYANGCTHQPVAFLEGIWVHPQHRRQGIGRSLLDAISDDLRAAGYQELCSDAELENRVSHQAHHKWGFVEMERVICFRRALMASYQ
jgi:aminoglycoside 6'-N-acetyltransferase I